MKYHGRTNSSSKILPTSEFSRKALLALLLGISLGAITPGLQANTEENQACQDRFNVGLQSHDVNGSINLGQWSVIKGAASEYFPTVFFNEAPGNFSFSCGAYSCSASGEPVEKLEASEFKTTYSYRAYTAGAGWKWPPNTLGYRGDTEYASVNVRPWAFLTFAKKASAYRIRTLATGHHSILSLNPGDYWIENLSLGDYATLAVAGRGTVRLYLKNPPRLGRYLKMNWKGRRTDTSQLFVYAYDDFASTRGEINGFIYSKSKVTIASGTSFSGSITAQDIFIGTRNTVNLTPYRARYVDFGTLCSSDS